MGAAIRAGGAYVEMLVKDGKFNAAIQSIQKRLDTFGKSVRNIGLGISAAGAAITAPFGLAVKNFAEAGDALDEMSIQTGVAVESLSALKYAAEFSSVSLEDLGSSIGRMQKNLAAGSAAFEKLGLSVDELMAMSPEQAFGTIADAINAIDNPTQRAAAAMSVFGKAGANLLPFLAEGKDGINELMEEAKDLGVVMGGDAAKSAAAFDDAMAKLWAQVGAVQNAIGTALAPVLTDILTRLQPIISSLIEFANQNQELIVTVGSVGAAVTIFGGALAALGIVITATSAGIGGLSKAVAAFGAVLSVVTKLNPILLAAGIVAAALALYFADVALSADDAAKAIERAADAGKRVKSNEGSPAFEGAFPKGRNQQGGGFDFSDPNNDQRPEFDGEFGTGKDTGTPFGVGGDAQRELDALNERIRQRMREEEIARQKEIDALNENIREKNRLQELEREKMLADARAQAVLDSERTLSGGNPAGVSNIAALQSLESGATDIQRENQRILQKIERHLDKGQVGRAV